MKPSYLLFALAIAFTTQNALAQDLNTTVSVTNAYEAKLESRTMPSIPISIPDTARQFHLGVNYDFLESEYQGMGAPEHFLTKIELTEASKKKPSTFHLTAGAGYILAPEAFVSWCPNLGNDKFSLGLYAGTDSYIGPYCKFDQSLYKIPGEKKDDKDGYESVNRAGIGGAYRWHDGMMALQLGYDNISALTWGDGERSLNGLKLDFFARSNHDFDKKLVYDFHCNAFVASDALVQGSHNVAKERDFLAKLILGGNFSSKTGLYVDAYARYLRYYGDIMGAADNVYAGHFYLDPRFIVRGDYFKLSLGLNVSAILKPDDNVYAPYGAEDQIFYPDIKAYVDLFHRTARLDLSVGGGVTPVTWTSLVRDNRLIGLSYSYEGTGAILDYEICRVNAVLGLKGNILDVFLYDFTGGYFNYANAPVDAVYCGSDGTLRPSIVWDWYQKAYGRAYLEGRINSLKIYGEVTGTWSDVGRGYRLPVLEAAIGAGYDYLGRVTASAELRYTGSRRSLTMPEIPGYFDLGVKCSYKFSSKVGFYIKGSNLLAQTLQYHPLVARKGVIATLGVTLNF